MNSFYRRLCLASAVVLLSSSALSAQDDKQLTRAINITLPEAWNLEIHSDGSGLVGYGALACDYFRFKKGTFDVEKVTKELKALIAEKKGGFLTHFGFSFESERKSDEVGPPNRYTRDGKLILALFKKAVEESKLKESGRGEFLRKNYPMLPRSE